MGEIVMILVVGATGQLGSLVVSQLHRQGRSVRAVIRGGAGRLDAADLVAASDEVVDADLADRRSLAAAVQGVDAVVATANVVAPTRPGDTGTMERRGYVTLVEECAAAGVRRFVLTALPASGLAEQVPQEATKRAAERALRATSMSHVSLRFAPFTEIWMALVGSSVPTRGEQHGTLARPYPFMQRFRRATGHSVESRGRMLVPGPSRHRNAFISVHDAATALVNAIDADLHGTVDVGGPQALSWDEVAGIYGDVLGRSVRVMSTPAGVFAAAQSVLRPVAPSAANIMGLNRLMGTVETNWQTADVLAQLGVTAPRTVEEVLREKAGLPPG
jgi:uncharacterized protein YbjT (DUF2867 family)